MEQATPWASAPLKCMKVRNVLSNKHTSLEEPFEAEKVFLGVCVLLFSSSGFNLYFSFSPFLDSCCSVALNFSALLELMWIIVK